MSADKRPGVALPRWKRNKEVKTRSDTNDHGVTSNKEKSAKNNVTKFVSMGGFWVWVLCERGLFVRMVSLGIALLYSLV
jgi:hypothetical protein